MEVSEACMEVPGSESNISLRLGTSARPPSVRRPLAAQWLSRRRRQIVNLPWIGKVSRSDGQDDEGFPAFAGE